MFKFINSKVNRKLTAMCILLAVLICLASCVTGYILYRDATYKNFNDFAYQIGGIALSHVNGDKIADYLKPEYFDENGKFKPDAEYEEMAKAIYQVYKSTSMHTYNSGIYICIPRINDEGNVMLTNLFDVRIIEADETKKQYYEVGVVDPATVDHPERLVEAYKTGEMPDDLFVHESAFGHNSTAMLPVKNSSGNTVALLMADMPMPYVSQSLTSFLINIVLVTIIVVAIFIALFITVVRKSITKPIGIISEEASKFTDSDIQISQKLAEITQPDEIGDLARDIYKMEGDIQNYVTNLTKVTTEKERISAELDVATNIQRSMLPCIFPAFPHCKEIDIYAIMDPAKEVGGDFYDFFMLDETHIAVVCADVSGKGVPAALFMVIGKTLIKDHTSMGKDLGDVFTEVNDLLCESNAQGLFITAFEGVVDLVTGEFRYVNAGHEIPFVSKKHGRFFPYKLNSGFVLAGLEGVQYNSGVINLEPGDRIFQYTDGVTEATNVKNELYGPKRLESSLNKNKDLPLAAFISAVREDVDEFVGEAPQFDDITMICVEFKEYRKPAEDDTNQEE